MIAKHRYVFILLILLLLGLSSVHPAQADNRAQIGLVIQFGDGTTVHRCIDGDGLTGYDLLERSGFELVASFSGAGAAICKIGGDGCPANNCFCEHPPNYWSYWHLQNGVWAYSPTGADSRSVPAGSVDGWKWGQGDPPPVIPFEVICTTPPTAIPTDTPLPPTATLQEPTPTLLPPTATLQEITPVITSTDPAAPPVETDQLPTTLETSTLPPDGGPTPSTPSPDPTETALATPSGTPTPLAVSDIPSDDHQDDLELELIHTAEESQSGQSRGAPVQFLIFGSILLLLSGALILYLLRQIKA